MDRRSFVKGLGLSAVGVAGLLSGCAVKTINPSVTKKEKEQPWRCGKCGLLLRSDEDMAGRRCPRCYAKKLAKITEAELEKYVKEAKKSK